MKTIDYENKISLMKNLELPKVERIMSQLQIGQYFRTSNAVVYRIVDIKGEQVCLDAVKVGSGSRVFSRKVFSQLFINKVFDQIMDPNTEIQWGLNAELGLNKYHI